MTTYKQRELKRDALKVLHQEISKQFPEIKEYYLDLVLVKISEALK